MFLSLLFIFILSIGSADRDTRQLETLGWFDVVRDDRSLAAFTQYVSRTVQYICY